MTFRDVRITLTKQKPKVETVKGTLSSKLSIEFTVACISMQYRHPLLYKPLHSIDSCTNIHVTRKCQAYCTILIACAVQLRSLRWFLRTAYS